MLVIFGINLYKNRGFFNTATTQMGAVEFSRKREGTARALSPGKRGESI
jgi:hypothetical protein